jgi:hypothetical protein
MPPADRQPKPFSEVLSDLRQGDPKLTLDEMVEAFGDRGIAAMILLLSIFSLLPWPPGSKAIFCLPIVLMASELALQRDEVWLPQWLLRRSLARDTYNRVIGKALKPFRFIENLTRPRLSFLTGPVSRLFIGLACALLAIMLALPIPFGDMLPGVTMILFGFGVLQRDGVAAILGWIGTAVCAGYLALVWTTVMAVGEYALAWIQGVL